MNATALIAITSTATLASGAGPGAAAWVAVGTAVVMLLPVVAATGVLAWHALFGTDPGPAAKPLLAVVRVLWGRPRG